MPEGLSDKLFIFLKAGLKRRLKEENMIVDSFTAEHPTQQILMITGVRGSGMTVNQFNPYRKRLIKKGIVNGDTWGIVRFTLPYFEQFVISMYEGETYD